MSLVVLGGDGLMSEVITGVVQAVEEKAVSPEEAVELTIVACGSANDLYRTGK